LQGGGGGEENVDPSDLDLNDLHNGASGDDGPTPADGLPGGGDGWWRSVVENSSEIVTVVDPDGTLRYANPAWARVLGYDPEQAVGTMNVLDHVHPDDLAHVLEETEEALAKGGVVTNEAEYRFRRKDGSWRWMQSVGTYLIDDPAVGGVVVSRDVTERKEAEDALRASEAEVFSVLESITDGFFSLDQEMRFAYVNSRAELLLGRSREDLVGERIWEDPTFYPHYLRAVAEGETVTFEGYYPPLGAWYGVRAYPSTSGLSVYFQDITGRKEAEGRLRFQSELLGAVGEAVIALDTEGRVLYWNRAAEEMYGWSSVEIMGRRLRDMVVPEDLRGRAEEIAGQLRAGRSWAGEFEVRRRDGTTFPVEGTDTPIFGEDGGLVGVIGVLRDITERKEAEEALRRNEHYFRSLVQNASDVVTVLEADGTIRYVSHAVEQVTGRRPEEQVGTNAFDSVHPEDRQRALGLFAEMLKLPGVHPPMEFRVPHEDGSWRYLEHVVNNLLDDASVNGVVVTSRDVTERKRAEEAIRESERRLRRAEERYRRLVEQVPAVVYVQEIGSPDSALYMSPRIEALTGYTPEECQEPDLRWRMVHPEDRERMRSEDERTGEPGEVFAKRVPGSPPRRAHGVGAQRVGFGRRRGGRVPLLAGVHDRHNRSQGGRGGDRAARPSQRAYPRLRRGGDLRPRPGRQDHLRQPRGGGLDRVRPRGAYRQGAARGHTPFPLRWDPVPEGRVPDPHRNRGRCGAPGGRRGLLAQGRHELSRRVHEHPGT
jgi:PAS domain S-box-containing protein